MGIFCTEVTGRCIVGNKLGLDWYYVLMFLTTLDPWRNTTRVCIQHIVAVWVDPYIMNTKPVHIGVIYRLPDGQKSEFIDTLVELLCCLKVLRG